MSNNNVEKSTKNEYDEVMRDPSIKTFNNFKAKVIKTIGNRKNITYNADVLQRYWDKHGQYKMKGGKRTTKKTRKGTRKTRKGRKASRKH